MKRLLILASLAAVFSYCGPSGSFDNGKKGNIANNTKESTNTGKPNQPPSNPPGPAPDPDPDPDTPSPGEQFFNLTVKPAFSGCAAGAACHKDGGAGFAGVPFDYLKAKAQLDGADAKSSKFYQKMRGKPAHVGGDTCAAGDNATPCKEVQDWWTKEKDPSGGTGNSTGTNAATGTGTGGGLRGQAFFTAMVEPKLTACNGCHAINGKPLDYAGAKAKLKDSPTATAKNNLLINKPALANGVTSHHGGTIKYCANIDTSSPCKEFQDWFAVEP